MVSTFFEEKGVFQVYTPTQIYFGYGCFEEGIRKAAEYGKKAIIVTGRSSAKRLGYLDRLQKALDELGIAYSTISGIPENPDEQTVEKCVEKAKDYGPDLFIALGGGSAIDAAKAINAAYSNGLRVEECYGRKIERSLPLIAIPTTAGTGSEVTRYAIITDPEEKTKKIIADFNICPKVAVVDPEFTLKLPRSVTVSSGLDALSHCIEGLFGYYSNPVIDGIALMGLKYAVESLPKVAESPDRESRLRMMLASLMGGIAINSVPTGLAHAMSYPLTSHFGIPHGIAVAMVLPYVLELTSFEEKLELVNTFLGVDIVETIRKFNESFGVPKKVEGLTEDLCERFSEQIIQNKQKLRNNAYIPTFEEVKEIFMNFVGGGDSGP